MKISISGLDRKKISFIKKNFKKVQFNEINDQNFKNHFDTSALLIFREKPLKNFLKNFFKKKIYKKFINIKWLHFSRTGLDEFSPYINKINFKVTTGRGTSSSQVAEHALAMILYLTRNLKFVNHYPLNLDINRYKAVEGKKILILGYGSIGKKIANKIKGFNVEIDIVGGKKDKVINRVFSLSSARKRIQNYFVVINCLPLTEKTKKIINFNFLKKIGTNSFFLNISRSGCLDQQDFIKYLKSKRFGGIGIDQIDDNLKKKIFKITKRMNLLITNHTADKLDNLNERFELLLNNLKKFIDKKKLINIYSKLKGY